eukprot:CAMPEP_0115028722 /NCGR_PEP_ID=MMETSP0216-20121206/36512_1 /TAXON_ID=223996 /ORGANISM="Protocruzia adherens, Strain Boccale" /LENGTH=251 /DNA_ID=CAMNT_0002405045 /DNA_START=21 /DNA_END=776 /DNA_ORIENTATION=+
MDSLDEFLEKYHLPLVRRLEKLEKENSQGRKEREGLLDRVCILDDQVEELTNTLTKLKTKLHTDEIEDLEIATPMINDRDTAISPEKKLNDADDEPWLFYCKHGTPVETICRTLDISDCTIVELDCTSWNNEKIMWTQLLEKFQHDYLKEEKIDKLSVLRSMAQMELSSACHGEFLLIIRNIPRKSEAQFDVISPHLGTLAEFVTSAWTEIEQANAELLGRIALILESKEEMDKLEIDQADSRLILYVEQL